MPIRLADLAADAARAARTREAIAQESSARGGGEAEVESAVREAAEAASEAAAAVRDAEVRRAEASRRVAHYKKRAVAAWAAARAATDAESDTRWCDAAREAEAIAAQAEVDLQAATDEIVRVRQKTP